ncbi:hypothetical protein KCP73_26135 [Salmonella enterica subsp. enterica]|nr:hypothetical protein KCP73_26135 [Salmonella enterica subsp. enterica]
MELRGLRRVVIGRRFNMTHVSCGASLFSTALALDYSFEISTPPIVPRQTIDDRNGAFGTSGVYLYAPVIGLVMMYSRGNPGSHWHYLMPHAAEANERA